MPGTKTRGLIGSSRRQIMKIVMKRISRRLVIGNARAPFIFQKPKIKKKLNFNKPNSMIKIE